MSGICGIFRLDGGPPEGIEAMAAHLTRRGPDGAHIVRDGALALGHTALNTTPESLHETLPFTHCETGCVITADLRLDNRDELIAALGLDTKGRVIGDGEIVLAAYLRWGEDCPIRLLGDFAFAVWDPRKRHLFCARDQMGMKQLIWHRTEAKVFAFASEQQAVLLAASVPNRINEGRIADFLEEYLEGIDYTSTFFEEVFRLPPAHCLTVSADRFDLRRYWTLEPGPELKLASDEDYAQAFLEVFTEAVRSRLRCNSPVGSMLSGGMDSGSVVAVASRLLAAQGRGPLHTFSGVGPDPENCIETRTIHAALAVPGLQPTLVNHADLGEWQDDLVGLATEIGEPFDVGMSLIRAVYLAAARAGVRVVLDGMAGDVTLGAGSYQQDLFASGRWRQLWREAVGEERFWGEGWSRWKALREATRPVLIPDAARQLRRHLTELTAHRPTGLLLDPIFARRVDLAARVHRYRNNSPPAHLTGATARATTLTQPFVTVARERYDRTASLLGVEPRDPFLDRRIVDLCLRLPADQLQHDGWPKMILRRSMAGMLPDAVRWRCGKEHLGYLFTGQLEVGFRRRATLDSVDGASRYWESMLRQTRQEVSGAVVNRQEVEKVGLLHWLVRHTPIGSPLEGP
jgi:asparagine synthase (glutamine-hydrolysing)